MVGKGFPNQPCSGTLRFSCPCTVPLGAVLPNLGSDGAHACRPAPDALERSDDAFGMAAGIFLASACSANLLASARLVLCAARVWKSMRRAVPSQCPYSALTVPLQCPLEKRTVLLCFLIRKQKVGFHQYSRNKNIRAVCVFPMGTVRAL